MCWWLMFLVDLKHTAVQFVPNKHFLHYCFCAISQWLKIHQPWAIVQKQTAIATISKNAWDSLGKLGVFVLAQIWNGIHLKYASESMINQLSQWLIDIDCHFYRSFPLKMINMSVCRPSYGPQSPIINLQAAVASVKRKDTEYNGHGTPQNWKIVLVQWNHKMKVCMTKRRNHYYYRLLHANEPITYN